MAIPKQWIDEDNVTKSQEIETAASMNTVDSSSLELKSADDSMVFGDASGNDPSDPAVDRPTSVPALASRGALDNGMSLPSSQDSCLDMTPHRLNEQIACSISADGAAKSAPNNLSDARKDATDVVRFSTEEIGVIDSSFSHVPAAMNGMKEQESTQSLKLKIENNRENGSPRTSGEMALPDSSDIIKPERNAYKIVPISEGDERKIDHELQLRIDYWRKALADAPVLLGLPTDRPRATQQSAAYSHLPIRFDAQLTQLLKNLGQ
ncbi:hypothetical protein BGZ80_004561, partial [Entomortierella chlamydospora]